MIMTYNDVLSYIASRPSPQRDVCARLRAIILDTLPEAQERMRFGVPYYWDECYIVALKDHVNLGFTTKYLTPAEIKQLLGTGKTTRVMEFSSEDDIDEVRIKRLLQLIWERKAAKHKSERESARHIA